MFIQNLHYLLLLMLFLSQPPNDSNSFIATYDVQYALGLQHQVTLSYADGMAHYRDHSNYQEIGNKSTAMFYYYFDHYDWYYNLNTKEIHEFRTFEDSTKVCSSWPDTTMQWEITNETSELLGYTCQKAIGKSYRANDKQKTIRPGHQIIAWYTTEVPVPIGPARYFGLPGLIVKLDLIKLKPFDDKDYTDPFTYTLSKINFNKDLEIDLPQWNNCIKVSKNQIINYNRIDNKKWKKEMKEKASN